jgi:signal transduction histidine kinase
MKSFPEVSNPVQTTSILYPLSDKKNLLKNTFKRVSKRYFFFLPQTQLQRISLQTKKTNVITSFKQLQELNTSRNSFLSIASHELRTPMTVIKGFTEFLLSEKFGSVNNKQREFLYTISRNTTDLIKLVNKMLDISRLEAGKMTFEFRNIAISEFLAETTREFQVLCSQKKITLQFKNPDKVNLFIKSDPFKVKQILTNLISNAFKFTPKKGAITIILEPCQTKGQCIQISVKDNGIGIPKKEQKHVFEKFHQVENSLRKDYTGTGLGLSIVKLMIERLGGEVFVISQKGKGACFTFTLPQSHEH